MACALTASFTLSCKDSIGGLKEVYFIEKENITDYTTSGDQITVITKASGKVFRKYEQIRETSSFTQTYNDNIVNGTTYVTQELEIYLPKLTTAMRTEVASLAQNRLVAVVVDNNGKQWVLGKVNGLDRNGGTASTGTAMADRNGYVLKFIALEPTAAYEFTGSVS